MKGDFTRDTFNPLKHFSRVLMQQGRVQLDADWNEQAAILLHYLRALAADLIGPFGGQENNCGFEMFNGTTTAKPKAGELKLSQAEIDRLIKAHVLLADGKLADGDFLIGKGRYYVDGLLCEVDDYALYTGQSHLPTTELLTKGRPYLAYLDVWERHITYLEDESFPSIREVALGGPDTATRTKVVWQVKVLAANEDDIKPTNKLIKSTINKTWKDDWVTRFEPQKRGLLKANIKEPEGADLTNPCLTPPDTRYRGAENQLYRVEIHRGGNGKAGGATFKWSRENGSMIFPILQLSGDTIKLAHLGKDIRQGLKVGDWVEIVTDEMVLSGTVPPLVQVDSIEPVDLTIRFKPAKMPPFEAKTAKPLLLRRWDHKADLKDDGAVKLVESNSDWLTLEDGVQIQFQPDGDQYRTGDYWLIPARTATGNIEWPKNEDGNLLSQPPHGVDHHYAPLAVITLKSGKVDTIADCRSTITPLAS